MHSHKCSLQCYTNRPPLRVVKRLSNTFRIMKKTFDFSPEQFHSCLLRTVSANRSYRLSFENTDRNRCTICYPEKAIVIDCHIVSCNGSTECYLSATSPFCVISEAHEQRILADLLSMLHTAIHQPVRQQTSPARRFSLWLKPKMSFNI